MADPPRLPPASPPAESANVDPWRLCMFANPGISSLKNSCTCNDTVTLQSAATCRLQQPDQGITAMRICATDLCATVVKPSETPKHQVLLHCPRVSLPAIRWRGQCHLQALSWYNTPAITKKPTMTSDRPHVTHTPCKCYFAVHHRSGIPMTMHLAAAEIAF